MAAPGPTSRHPSKETARCEDLLRCRPQHTPFACAPRNLLGCSVQTLLGVKPERARVWARSLAHCTSCGHHTSRDAWRASTTVFCLARRSCFDEMSESLKEQIVFCQACGQNMHKVRMCERALSLSWPEHVQGVTAVVQPCLFCLYCNE